MVECCAFPSVAAFGAALVTAYGEDVAMELKPVSEASLPTEKDLAILNSVKFEVFGEEMVEKQVKPSGNSGRVYLPPDWVGSRVKVIRIG
ncbi:MAG: DUF2080 family transposase-associated protein [Syntrophobacteraceae bacterium]